MNKKGQTNKNKCIRTRLNVQCRRCPNHKMFEEGTKATWSCVFTMLCVSVDAVKNKKPRVSCSYKLCYRKKNKKTKKKRKQFLLSGGVSFFVL